MPLPPGRQPGRPGQSCGFFTRAAHKASLPPDLTSLGLTRLPAEELRAVFDRVSGGGASGENGFGAAGAAHLLDDAMAAEAAEIAAGGWATFTPGGQRLPASAEQVVAALDRNGDGNVSWEDFQSSVGDAAEVVDRRVMYVAGSLLFNFVAQVRAHPFLSDTFTPGLPL